MAAMSGDEELAAWLRRTVEADLEQWRAVVAYLEPVAGGLELVGDGPLLPAGVDVMQDAIVQLGHARDHVAQGEANLAILDRYERQEAKAGENAMQEDRAWVLWPVLALLGYGYRFRPGYQEEWKP